MIFRFNEPVSIIYKTTWKSKTLRFSENSEIKL